LISEKKKKIKKYKNHPRQATQDSNSSFAFRLASSSPKFLKKKSLLELN
jgi:hypothetical protein